MKLKLFISVILLFIIQLSFCQKTSCGFAISKNEKKDFNIENKRFKSNKSNTITNYNLIEIPVVFHVIYNGDYNNLDSQKILLELADLNRDFQLLNLDIANVPEEFEKAIGNPNIKFTIATTDPNGNTTNGIIRVKGKRNVYNFSNEIFFADPVWNPKKYLNVYIGNIRNGKTHGYVNAWPWKNSGTDGIGLHYENVGKSSRLLTHETGHWLGLWHITEGGCSRENDEIEDTPKQKSFTNGCPTSKKECDNNNMFMNYMDYSDCRTMFTIGQCDLIRNVLQNYRPGLLN